VPDRWPIITIDGPSGSGKGTIARRVARQLDWHLLDSGALYRLVALAARQSGLDPADEAAHAACAIALDVRFGATPEGEEQIWLAGTDVTAAIRTERAGEDASRVAVMPAVRAALLDRQRAFAAPPGLVADGRDMGTVVFPLAELKIFLTASPEERARRRHKQLKDKGLDVSLAALSREIAERDRRDMSRAVAPLVAASDALIVDSTSLTIDAVVDRVLAAAGRFV
jgi:cytidylate kinase